MKKSNTCLAMLAGIGLSVIQSLMCSSEGSRIYFIHENGVNVGSTSMRTFTVKGLSPGKSYVFSVTSRKDPAGPATTDHSIQVLTKNRGNIFNVRKFGAKGDDKNGDGPAIQKAINSTRMTA